MQKHCISVEDVYGTAAPEVPQGYELTGEFRPYKAGETVLLKPSNGKAAHKTFADGDALYPRLILRAKKLPTIQDIYGAPLEKLTPPIGYRFTGEFRPPAAFEIYCTCSMEAYDYVKGMPPQEARLILEKLPPTPTIKDVYGTDNPPIPAGWKFKEFRQIGETEECVPYLSQAYYKVNDSKEPPGNLYDRWRIVLEQDLSQFRYTITPEYIYGGMPKVPEGYKVVDFRPPLTGELFLSLYGGNCDTARSNFASPRFILSPLGPR